jgi:hypothetical protein
VRLDLERKHEFAGVVLYLNPAVVGNALCAEFVDEVACDKERFAQRAVPVVEGLQIDDMISRHTFIDEMMFRHRLSLEIKFGVSELQPMASFGRDPTWIKRLLLVFAPIF